MYAHMMHDKIIIIYGPTGVGKTDLSLALAEKFPIEIINGDLGQFYVPLSIGTAKPDWRHEAVAHHLFDVLDKPENFTVVQYRALLLQKVADIQARGKIPVIVGGSGFYIKSLFFPPKNCDDVVENHQQEESVYRHCSNQELWQLLESKDAQRAQKLYVTDRYRIERALALLDRGIVPSACQPDYISLDSDVLLVFCNRPREQLKERIKKRTESMLLAGWLHEVSTILLHDKMDVWKKFLTRKKLIGYPECIAYLESEQHPKDKALLIEIIQNKTWQYAKRQITFWKTVEKQLNAWFTYPSCAQEIFLSQEGSVAQFMETVRNFIEAKK